MNEPAPESPKSTSGWMREADILAADAELARAQEYVELWTRLGGAPLAGCSAAECADALAYWSARASRAREAREALVGGVRSPPPRFG